MIDPLEIDFMILTVDPLYGEGTFTRSNGSIVARIYERLTKASRRRKLFLRTYETGYRQGVYDAFTALRKELLGNKNTPSWVD